MPLNFPGIFPPGREIQINFDWIDIASATGYVVFDGVNAPNSSGAKYTLIDSSKAASSIVGTVSTSPTLTIQSSTWSIFRGSGSGGSPANVMDIDFDLSPFQLPRTIEGEGYVKISLVGDAATNQNVVIITAKLRKWDGSTETEIISETSPTEESLSTNEEISHTLNLTIPQTHFKQGEQLRLTIVITSEDNLIDMGIAHNPRDTALTGAAAIGDFTVGNTRLTLAIPFKMNQI